MTQFIESFFDENNPNFKLWKKMDKKIVIKPEEIIHEGCLYKVDSNQNQIKERYLVLTKDDLYYFKSQKKKKVKGIMKTKFVRVEYFTEKSGNACRYHIRLIKNLKYSEFFTDSEENSEIW